jgi:hypothetical protein
VFASYPSKPVQMAEKVTVNLTADDTPVWATTIKTESSSPTNSSTPPSTSLTSSSASIPHKYGPKPKPRPASSPVPIVAPSCHEYPDSVPDFDEESATTHPSAAPNGPRGLPKQLAEAEEFKADQDPLEVQITKLVRIPPAPPGLVPRTLPQTHPLSQLRQQHSTVDSATSGLQQVLDRLQQKYPEKQGHQIPTANPPLIVRHDPATAPSVLVPLSVICQHCGAINLLVKDPLTDQVPHNLRVPK